MICLNCNAENYEVVMAEKLPCADCDSFAYLEYCLCQECGSMWRGINGEVDEQNMVSPDELMNMINPMGNIVAINPEHMVGMDDDFINRIESELLKHDNKEDASSMADLVHNCMKCQALAYETKPGYYECSECDFSWEVIDS